MMRNILILLCLFSSTLAQSIENQSAQIKFELHKKVSETHIPLSYEKAGIDLFTILDNHQGVVCSVYSPSFCITTDIVPSAKIMNVEHTWPQSLGAMGIAKSDLHHLFATKSSTNSMRSSLPFCNVVTVKWEDDQSKRGIGSFGEACFEPPTKHKGNVARALFYFSIRYNLPIDSHQEFYLRLWNKEDPVDADEIQIDQIIFSLQKNKNPFISNPELVDQITDF